MTRPSKSQPVQTTVAVDARQRMLDAHAVMDRLPGNRGWEIWQQAAADYWVVLHPEVAHLRRGDPNQVPDIDAMKRRERHLWVAMDGVPPTWRIDPSEPDRAEHMAQVGWYHEQSAGLYEPIYLAISRLRAGGVSGIEPAIRFLEADLYCDRSGYVKADVIKALTRVELDPHSMDRLRAVVLMVIESYDRREFRAYCRLARRLDSEPFRAGIRERLGSDASSTRRHADWVLAALGDGSRPTSGRQPIA